MKILLILLVIVLNQNSFANTCSEQKVLALTIMYEARGEPLEGKFAIADVVFLRVQDKYWPKTVCEVVFFINVYGNREFSWVTEYREKNYLSLYHNFESSKNETILKEWEEAKYVAMISYNGYLSDLDTVIIECSRFYYSKLKFKLKPPYSMRKMVVESIIGNHVFVDIPSRTCMPISN